MFQAYSHKQTRVLIVIIIIIVIVVIVIIMVFSLLKLCYRASSQAERDAYDAMGTTPVDLRPCCMLLVGRSRNRNNGAEADQQPLQPNRYDVVRGFELEAWLDVWSGRHRTLESAVCTLAAGHGHLDCLMDARRKGYAWDAGTCEAAARNGHLHCLRYARANGCAWDESTARLAAGNGHLECLRYALLGGCPVTANTCREASFAGRLECLRYAREKHGCPWDSDVSGAAALRGHWAVLEYLRANGCPWGPDVSMLAAAGGHVHVLRYLRLNGCPWDKWTTAAAACVGRLECLRFARDNGCDWDVYAYRAAAAGGHDECAEYMMRERCPADEWAQKVIMGQGPRLLRGRSPCPWSLVGCEADAVRGNHFKCLLIARDLEIRHDGLRRP